MKDFRSKVYEHMLRTRGWKYRSFLRYLRAFKYAACAPQRGEFLESYYTLMRYVDDIVDGDAPLPPAYANETEYILEKIAFSQHPENPKDEVDHLMLHCLEVGRKFGENFQAETSDILGSLLFDAKRRGRSLLFSRTELEQHFYQLDIRGTIRATLKVFNDDPDKFTLLAPLGTACRHQFNIEDFETDMEAGYINIPREDFEPFDIDPEELHLESPGVQAWLRRHAEEGLDLLAEHHRLLPQGDFSRIEKLTFILVYERPARQVFQQLLSTTNLKAVVR